MLPLCACLRVLVCVCVVTYWNQCGWLQSKTTRHEASRTQQKETTKLTHLQSQKSLLVAAAHGALPRLEHIDGVYVRQDVLECELQMGSYRLHDLYQWAVFFGHSAYRMEASKETGLVARNGLPIPNGLSHQTKTAVAEYNAAWLITPYLGITRDTALPACTTFICLSNIKWKGKTLQNVAGEMSGAARDGRQRRLVGQLAELMENACCSANLRTEIPFHRWPPAHPSLYPAAIWLPHWFRVSQTAHDRSARYRRSCSSAGADTSVPCRHRNRSYPALPLSPPYRRCPSMWPAIGLQLSEIFNWRLD